MSSKSHPSVSCSSNEQMTNESERNLMDLISDWKSKSRMDSQYDRIKKFLFSFNQKPTDFKPSDFFPPIPDSEIASDSEEKTIDKCDQKRKSLSKRKLDYENLVDDPISKQQSHEELLNASSLNENEKQRRQPVTNDFNDLNQLSPINSPTQTNRNLLKLNRASLLKQLDNENGNSSHKKKSISPSCANISSVKSPARLFPSENESIRKPTLSFKETTTSENKSGQKIESDKENDIENNNQQTAASASLNEDMNIFNPPTRPPVLNVSSNQPAVTRSSITVTKRRSAEPVRDILVDLSNNVPAKPKSKLAKQKAISKVNESMNDDQTELLSSQLSTFIRRKSTLSNKTSNSIVNNSSSASVLFRPVRSKGGKDLNDLPPPPLFTRSRSANTASEHETTTNEDKSVAVKAKKLRHKKSTKKTSKKQKEPHKEPSEQICDVPNDQIDQNLGNEQDMAQIAQVEPEVHPEKSPEACETKITSFFDKKTSQKKDKKVQKANIDLDVREKDGSRDENVRSLSPTISNPKPSQTTKKNSKNKKENSENKAKNSRPGRQPLKNIQNQEPTKAKASSSSQKEVGYFTNNKTIAYEPKLIDECENDPSLALRRSKRAKIDKNSQPIYGYEEISDYKGNKCIVRKVIGTKDKIDIKINKELMRINHYLVESQLNTKVNKKKRETKNAEKKTRKNSTKEKEKLIAIADEEIVDKNLPNYEAVVEQADIIQPDNQIDFNQVEPDHRQQDENIEQTNSRIGEIRELDNKKDNESLSTSLNSNVNNSMEFIFSNEDDLAKPIHLYFFNKNIDKKTFQNYSKGVQISPISDLTGILRINGLSSTKTNYHDFAVNYFVQNGTFLFSLNGLLSIHNEKDVIYIPKNTPYKIKNLAENEDNFAYIFFRFDN